MSSTITTESSTHAPSPHYFVWIANISLLAVAAVWGSSYGIAKKNLEFMPVLWFLTLRFGLTFIALFPALMRTHRQLPKQLHETFRIGSPLGLVLLSIFILETFGMITSI